MDKKLLNCPFCGSDHIRIRTKKFTEIYCTTPYCHGNYSKKYPDEVAAIKAWNTRPPQERCELVKLDEKEVMNILEFASRESPYWSDHKHFISKAICQKFGTAPAQKTLSLEEIEQILRQNMTHFIHYHDKEGGRKSEGKAVFESQFYFVARAIKAKLDENLSSRQER